MQQMLFTVLSHAPLLPDTVLMRVVPAETSGLHQFLAAAEVGAVVLAYVLVATVIWAVFRLRHSLEGTRASLDGFGRDLRTLADNANRISVDVAAVAASVRTDVASVHETIDYANRRARHAVTVLADHVDEFNGALGIVQDDTQNVVFSALAALKGVRAGLAALRGGRGGKRRGRRDPRREEPGNDAEPPIDLVERPRLRRREPTKR